MSNSRITPRGIWNAAANYITLDAVSHNDFIWLALQASEGEEPVEQSAYWLNIGSTWNDAGKVALLPRGNYNQATAYEYLDVVMHNNSSYVAKQSSVGKNPETEQDYWQALVYSSELLIMNGATAQTDGAPGSVPKPLAGEQNKFLSGGGNWEIPEAAHIHYGHTTAGSAVHNVEEALDGINASLSAICDLIYPVGSIYMTTDNTNPSTRFAGTTWVQWGAGRVPVGVDASDSDFDAVEETGGAKSHSYTPAGTNGNVGATTLTAAQSGIPAHSHTMTHGHSMTQPAFKTESGGSHSHTSTNNVCGTTSSTFNPSGSGWCPSGTITSITINSGGSHSHTVTRTTNAAVTNFTGSTSNNTATNASASHTHSGSTFTGTASTQSHIQPYITCYMWKRTA